MPISKIDNSSVSERVYDQMLCLIVGGEWVPGEQLPTEDQLTQEFDVSRISVRTALSKLESLGVIEKARGRGTYIKEITGSDISSLVAPLLALCRYSYAEIAELRKVLEPPLAVLAAERATDADIAELGGICEKMEECREKNNYQGFLYHDIRFHNMIISMTHNSFIQDFYGIVSEAIRVNFTKFNAGAEAFPEPFTSHHRAIYEAIAKHDAAATGQLLSEHHSFDYTSFSQRNEA